MRVCAPVVGSEQITAMFQNHLHDDKSLHYGEFINDLTKYLVSSTQSDTSFVERHLSFKASREKLYIREDLLGLFKIHVG